MPINSWSRLKWHSIEIMIWNINKYIYENIETNNILIISGCFNYRVEASFGLFFNELIIEKEKDLVVKDQLIKIIEDKNNQYSNNVYKF